MTIPTSPSAAARPRVLVVDDEPDLRTLYELTLVREGYDVHSAGSVEEGWALLGQSRFDVLLTDMRLPDGTGLDLLQRLDAAGRGERAIVITAFGSAENAVGALKAGAFDYLTKPVDLKRFRAIVAAALRAERPGRRDADAGSAGGGAGGGAADARAVQGSHGDPGSGAAGGGDAPRGVPGVTLARSARAAPTEAVCTPDAPVDALARLIGGSDAMAQVRAKVAKVARSMAPVHVRGESGTGKELVARAVHLASPRATGPFVAVNCGAIPENLLEAEFFGYRKGSFTGAAEDRAGFFQAAAGGTLFLDEIGDLPLAMQTKLLRAVQERAVRPIGAVAEQSVDVRLVSATHRDLAAEVQAGRFRQDLYYRLNVIGIEVPALRDRREDLPALCAALLRRIADDSMLEVPELTPEAMQCLAAHTFPGNVRELENLLHRAIAMGGGAAMLDAEDLGLARLDRPARSSDASHDASATVSVRAPAMDGLPSDLQAHLDAVERDILERALIAHRYNRTAAGASLGLSLRQMRYRMARLNVLGLDGGEV